MPDATPQKSVRVNLRAEFFNLRQEEERGGGGKNVQTNPHIHK